MASIHAVLFTAAGRSCAVAFEEMMNIVPCEPVTALPGSPAGVRGVVSFGGRTTLVVDPSELLGGPATTGGPKSCLLFIGNATSGVYGVLADSVDGVVDGETPEEALLISADVIARHCTRQEAA